MRRDRDLVGWVRSAPFAIAAVAIPTIVYLAIVLSGYDGVTYLRGDGGYYYRVTQSMLRDADLDLSNQLPGGHRRHAHQVAWSIDGRPVPKHPILLPVLSAPFVAAFGERGALIFNVTQLIALAAALFGMARLVAAPAPAALASVATSVATMLPHYAYNYSPDVLATLVLVSVVLVLRQRSIVSRDRYAVAGLLAGLAVFAKNPLVLFVPGLLLLFRPLGWRPLVWFGVGAVVPLIGLMALNTHFFGTPFTTSYNYILHHRSDGTPLTYSMMGAFRLPITTGMRAQLFDPKNGLLATSLLTVVSWLGLPALVKRDAKLAIYATSGALATYLLYSIYWDWNTSHYGNRFLLPVVALAVLPLAALFDAVAARFGGGIRAIGSRKDGGNSRPAATSRD